RRRRRGLHARCRAARPRPPLGRRDRSERGALSRGARARDAGAGARREKVLLNGRKPPSPETGKVGAILGPALEEAGHELVATEADADAMIDFTAPDAVVGNVLRALGAGVPCIVGTSGWDTALVDVTAKEAGLPVFHAPNFALGAVLMMRFAR